MTQSTAHRFVVSDPDILGGEPIISGTRTPIRAVVELWRSGIAPEEIPTDLPHISLAQVFDALSYYSQHTAEINGHVEANRGPLAVPRPAIPGLGEFDSGVSTVSERAEELLRAASLSGKWRTNR